MSWLPGSWPRYIPDVRLAPLSQVMWREGRSHGGTKAATRDCFATRDPQESRRHMIWMLTSNAKVATLRSGEGRGGWGQVELETRVTQAGRFARLHGNKIGPEERAGAVTSDVFQSVYFSKHHWK